MPAILSGGETYFIDAWDTKKGIARLKSFENGRTIPDEGVAGALAEWSGGL